MFTITAEENGFILLIGVSSCEYKFVKCAWISISILVQPYKALEYFICGNIYSTFHGSDTESWKELLLESL